LSSFQVRGATTHTVKKTKNPMKKPYTSPKLIEYGAVNNLTKLFANSIDPTLAPKPVQALPTPPTQSSGDNIVTS
jgi:hypothetical protein